MNLKNIIPSEARSRLQRTFAATALFIAMLAGALLAQPFQAFADEDLGSANSAADAQTIQINETKKMFTDDDLSSLAEISDVVSPAIDIDSLADALNAKVVAKWDEERATRLISTAVSFVGTPYVYGGTTPSGFDCSGFVRYCTNEALGIELPRTSGAQSGVGQDVSFDELEPGDLLFWGGRRGVYHVGIYIGDGNYVHSESTGIGVCIRPMEYNTPSFAKRFL